MPTLTMSKSGFSNLLPYTSSETWTIAPGISASALNATVYDDTYSFCGLVNQGSIFESNPHSSAVVFLGVDNCSVENDSLISAGGSGVSMFGDGMSVINKGSLTGVAGVGIEMVGQAGSVENHSDITGFDGIFMASFHGLIDNWSGKIEGTRYGINLGDGSGTATVIDNAAGATIRGTSDSLHANSASSWFILDNQGTMKGDIDGAASMMPNGISNGGTINGSIFFGSGADMYSGEAGGTVTGVIHAGDGADRLVSGAAKEVYWGEGGADKFVFNAIADSPNSALHDVIEDFNAAQLDKIDVHAIDADAAKAGQQHFVFIGTDTFAHYHSTHANVVGMLRFGPGLHQLQGNVNGNFANAEFAVDLPSVNTLHASDLILA